MRNLRNLASLLTFSSIALSSCVPYVARFALIDVPGATYVSAGGGPGNLSPRTVVYFPYHEVHVSLNLRTLVMGIHVPNGTAVQLNDRTLRIEGTSGGRPYYGTFKLRAVPHTSIFPREPQEFSGQPDPYTSGENFGPLRGAGEGSKIAWYLFLAEEPTDPQLLVRLPSNMRGTILLPSMNINGQLYDPQVVSFAPKTFAGLENMN